MGILQDTFISLDAVKEALNKKNNRQSGQKTYLFDFEKKEFVTDTLDNVISTDEPKECLKQIVQKILQDARYKYLIYGRNYGNELDLVLEQEDPPEVFLLELERVFEDALVYHPQIKSISEFSAEIVDDMAFCSFVVTGVNGTEIIWKEELAIG